MLFQSSLSALTLAAGLLMKGVSAGAGANFYACVYYQVDPISPIQVSFSVKSSFTHCMNSIGNANTTTVTSAGLTCASLGYVEEKGSDSGGDLCASDKSIWGPSYVADTLSGSTLSNIAYGNSITLYDSSNGTVVCGSEALCSTTKAPWDKGTQGPIYLIFNPEAQIGGPQPKPSPCPIPQKNSFNFQQRLDL